MFFVHTGAVQVTIHTEEITVAVGGTFIVPRGTCTDWFCPGLYLIHYHLYQGTTTRFRTLRIERLFSSSHKLVRCLLKTTMTTMVKARRLLVGAPYHRSHAIRLDRHAHLLLALPDIPGDPMLLLLLPLIAPAVLLLQRGLNYPLFPLLNTQIEGANLQVVQVAVDRPFRVHAFQIFWSWSLSLFFLSCYACEFAHCTTLH